MQLSLRGGDEVKVLEKVNDTWWWVEVNGEVGYAPANHLSSEQQVAWENKEYFSSYDALVSHTDNYVIVVIILKVNDFLVEIAFGNAE
jgi:hypothetical protein